MTDSPNQFDATTAPGTPPGTVPGAVMSEVVLVATGLDHPGILDEISHFVGDRGARIEAVKVANLSGRFALVMRLHADAVAAGRLEADIDILSERGGIRASIDRSVSSPATGAPFRLVMRGGPGTDAEDEVSVLQQASNLLRVLNVNIFDVTTDPDAEAFDIRMALNVPPEVPTGKFRELLGQLLDGLGTDWALEAEKAD